MAMPILSENSDVVLCSHQGLSSADIVQDCLEKLKALIVLKTHPTEEVLKSLEHQYFSVLDDLVDIALREFSQNPAVNLSP